MKRSKAIRFIRKIHRSDMKKTISVNPGTGCIKVETIGFTYYYNFNNGVLSINGYTYTEEEIDKALNNDKL